MLDHSDSPLLGIRLAAVSLGDEPLSIQLQAAQRRCHDEDGKPFSGPALHSAEKKGEETWTGTIAAWAEAWGVRVEIEGRSKRGQVFAFDLTSLPFGVPWKAMRATVEALGLTMRVKVVRKG